MRIIRFFFLLLLALSFLFLTNALAEDTPQLFFCFDLNSADAWQEPLSNVRFFAEGAWSLSPLSAEKCAEYGLSPDAYPSTEGLDTLNASASAAFSEAQFRQLAGDIRALAGDRQVWVVDCRLESHGLINGIAVAWYGAHNWANKGLSLAEAQADEALRFVSLPGHTITVYTQENDAPVDPHQIAVETTLTERQLVESEGFHYLRLEANDHSWPEEEAVDAFIAFVEKMDSTVGQDNIWLHFHCHAGKSRTGIFLAIYDMIRNPQISFEDIMLRHAMSGSSYLPYANSASDLADVYALRARRIRQVYDYLHDRDAQMPWSEWIAQERAE